MAKLDKVGQSPDAESQDSGQHAEQPNKIAALHIQYGFLSVAPGLDASTE